MLPHADSYEKLLAKFRWAIPDRFNIGVDVCDNQDAAKPAILFDDDVGAVRIIKFGELRALTNRFANALGAHGIARGDRVGILLQQSPETAIAHIASYKAGLIAVPLFVLFGEDALEYRLGDCGAACVVTDLAQLPKLLAIRARLPALRAIVVVDGTGIDGNTAIVSYEKPATLEAQKTDAAAQSRAANAAPAWLRRGDAPEEPVPPKPLVPSREGQMPAAASPLAGARADAIKRGALIHRLLQTLPDLPPEARDAAARRFLARPGNSLDAAQQDEIARETLALFDLPDFAEALSGEGLAEAPIVARVGGRALSGRIDRLVVRDDVIFVLDYKTNRPPPERIEDVPAEYVAQLAAYRAALAPLYPGRPIRAGLVWTYAPRLQEIPAELLDAHAP
ncbi:MAG: AMP-binding protein [Proteobacteria bacterium]|nr:AMP-binding protein [Pseudomonadota bacterium]